ncbi:apical endosomal glycoprotein-like [Acanthochromis polyacanthus]|uniref:apical endosomal glycoprotein-like n=1 Tax=Acanthochromis polyacanthus TaxID=80966 RepID=UPI00223471E5|nr:apical endosomal glycoprotein-like [Acanthochromis polyacanthus]
MVGDEPNRNIAIDDLIVLNGACPPTGFCDFEMDFCGWVNNPPSEFGLDWDWLSGWYMAVEPHQGVVLSPAALQSPTMKQASATCTLHFYYNIYGEDKKDLHVLLKEDSRTTTLWWLSGNHGDLWKHGEVTIGRVSQDFSILFEASRTFNHPGHIAIDDLDFTNCTLPEPQPQCPDGMFMCSNRVCVDPNHVCDFSDDCGDWSDENNCG